MQSSISVRATTCSILTFILNACAFDGDRMKAGNYIFNKYLRFPWIHGLHRDSVSEGEHLSEIIYSLTLFYYYFTEIPHYQASRRR